MSAACLTSPLAAGLNEWTSEGPFGGVVRDVAVDTVDPDLVYAEVYRSEDAGDTWSASIDPEGPVREIVPVSGRAGFAYLVSGGGVWKTTDGGESWRSLLEGDSLDLAFSPSAPDTLFVAHCEEGSPRYPSPCGVQRSTDGGETWSYLPAPPEYPVSVVVDPKDPDTVLVGSNEGLWKGTDGGETWARVRFEGSFEELAFDRSDATILYAATSVGLERSADGAETWTRILEAERLEAFDTHPSTGRIWVADRELGLLTSGDRGETWESRSSPDLVGSPLALGLDPFDSNRLLAGTLHGVFRSADQGATWQPSHTGIRDIWVHAVHQGGHGVPILLGTSGGLFRGGLLPEHLVGGLSSPVEGLASPVPGSETVYANSRGLWRSGDRGATWTKILGHPLSALAVAPSDGNVLYAAQGVFLRSSFDGGESWASVELPFSPYDYSVAVDAIDPRRVYAAAYRGLFVSEDGLTFAESDSPPPGHPVLLESDPYRGGRLFVLSAAVGTLETRWFRTEDHGANWTSVGEGLEGLRVEGLEFDPRSPDLLYAATVVGVMASIDGGATWAPLRGNLDGVRILDVALDTQDPDHLLAGTVRGLYEMDRVTKLSLRGGRFQVEVEWRDYDGARGQANVATIVGNSTGDVPVRAQDSAILRFFHPANWEAQVKVLDGRSLNDHFWVFSSAATDVGYELVVTDTACGVTRTYRNPLGRRARAITDSMAFPGCVGGESSPSCVPGPDVVCLGKDDRFRVRSTWTDYDGNQGSARQVTLQEPGLVESRDSGAFYFFGPRNWELIVKVLNGCPSSDHFWVFAAASTDVAYTLRVTDTVAQKTRVYRNSLGQVASAIADTAAFATCP